MFGCGNNHGFSETIATNLSGDQWVTVWAISVGGGDNTLLYDNVVHIDPAPQYYLDINGWLDGIYAIDLGAYGTVDIYINGQLVANDVNDYYYANATYPRGSTYEIKDIKSKTGYTYNGVHEGSLTGTLNDNVSVVLNFSKGVVPDGYLETATGGAGNVTIGGWAYDPDASSSSIDIHAYLVDSSGKENWLGSTKTNVNREDVNKAKGITGNHGFNAKFYTGLTGTYTVRVYGINVGGGSGNPIIGSKTVTITKCTTHQWNAGTVTKAATCSAAGTKSFTCTNCGTTKTETIAALGHSYGAWAKLNDTQHQRVCSRDSSHVEKANHTWNNGTVTQAATCVATGIKTYTCTVCNATKTETVAIDSTNHVNTTNVAATASTCTVKGYTAGVYCNDCKKYISGHQEQPLAAHQTETRNARAATCTAEGYTGDQYCTVCKQTISTGTTIGKKAHTLTTINKKNADCTTAGYTGDQYCTVCKQTISKGSATNALGHTSPDGNGNCTRCGAHIKDVTPTQPSQPQPNPNACKWCGKVHNGNFFDKLVGFFHSILAIFKR